MNKNKELNQAIEKAKEAKILAIDVASTENLTPEIVNYCTQYVKKHHNRIIDGIKQSFKEND